MLISHGKSSRRDGFTLVELLVTIAIILVLASLAFLAFSRAKRSAKSAATITNLREIGVAAAAWMTENGNFYMPCWDNNEGRNQSYAQVLDPYLHGVEEFRNEQSKFIGPNARLKVKVNEFSHPITYSLNRAVCRDITAYGRYTETLVHATQVERVNEVILMADGCQNPSNLNQANASAYRIYSLTGEMGPRSQFGDPIEVGPDVDKPEGDGWFRYPYGKCHALMCDGSAKIFPKGTIKNRNLWIDRTRD
jgi:prepilin-type N-terminal cleavage/methylation domain-containing protein